MTKVYVCTNHGIIQLTGVIASEHIPGDSVGPHTTGVVGEHVFSRKEGVLSAELDSSYAVLNDLK